MTDQQHTPNLNNFRRQYALLAQNYFTTETALDVAMAEFDLVIAAAEQRGAEAAILCEHNPSWDHHDQTDDFPCTNCRTKARKRLEGDE